MRHSLWTLAASERRGEVVFGDGQYMDWDATSKYSALRWTTPLKLGEVVATLTAIWGEPDAESRATFSLVSAEAAPLTTRQAIEEVRNGRTDADFLRMNFSERDAAVVWDSTNSVKVTPAGYAELGVLCQLPVPKFITALCIATAEPELAAKLPGIVAAMDLHS